MTFYVRYIIDVHILRFQIISRVQFMTQEKRANAITHNVKEAIIRSKESTDPALYTTLNVTPRLGLILIYLSKGSNEGDDAPAPIASLVVVSCEFERIENITFLKNYLANYVEKLQ